MKEQLKKAEERMGRRIDHLCTEYSEIRAGRANAYHTAVGRFYFKTDRKGYPEVGYRHQPHE